MKRRVFRNSKKTSLIEQDGVKHLISLMQWIGKCIQEHNIT
jgi:hypothetical protein